VALAIWHHVNLEPVLPVVSLRHWIKLGGNRRDWWHWGFFH
jgi:hypothetical protein